MTTVDELAATLQLGMDGATLKAMVNAEQYKPIIQVFRQMIASMPDDEGMQGLGVIVNKLEEIGLLPPPGSA